MYMVHRKTMYMVHHKPPCVYMHVIQVHNHMD